MKALKKIHENTDCTNCPFENDQEECGITKQSFDTNVCPQYWQIKETLDD